MLGDWRHWRNGLHYHVWNEFILKDRTVDAGKLRAVAEDLMLYIETHYYHATLRPEVPKVLAELKYHGLENWTDQQCGQSWSGTS